MIFLLTIASIIFVLGLRLAVTVLLFYRGQRRELYFQAEQAWIGTGRLAGTLIFAGGLLLMLVILRREMSVGLMIVTGFMLISLWWAFSPLVFEWLPPGWVREIETGRTPQEIDTIIQNGAAMLIHYPHIFRQIIRDEVGWEAWLLTNVGYIPLVSLDIYVKRAQQAMDNHLHPIAIVAAEHIIKYRPDQGLGYALRAQAHFRNHRYDLALDDYSRALERQPHQAEWYFQRGRLHILLEQPERALADLEQALALQPTQIEWQHLRENVLKMLEKASVRII